MEKKKNIEDLCNENGVEDIYELSELFLYWIDCGYPKQVVCDLESLERNERKEFYDWCVNSDKEFYAPILKVIIDNFLA